VDIVGIVVFGSNVHAEDNVDNYSADVVVQVDNFVREYIGYTENMSGNYD
jgi:hypothetical protein